MITRHQLENPNQKCYKCDGKAELELRLNGRFFAAYCVKCDRENEWQDNFGACCEKNIICPYCGYENHPNCCNNRSGEYKCDECEKEFEVEVEVTYRYSTQRRVCDMPDDWDYEKKGGD